ncbi:MAG: hypothetical protein QGI05_03340 [Candidatus Omnitrophota bacterium]|jgi:hypothetical protein|nr:hypothetical protein [Candidatus Omnitrophota bacterium]|tara:strand:+ start:274 stop:513 length:240 start_codon:yes stop_codon:yes gene_type:complete
MAKRAGFSVLFLVVVISLGILSAKGFGKDDYSDISKEERKLSVISEKIDEILKNQQDIITRLQDVQEQQDIIRVRASRK